MYRLYLFGGFRLERDGVEIRLPAQKSKALLAYLALYPQEHPREKLAALFWGDSSDHDARKSLRVAFQHLYKALGREFFDGDYEIVRFTPGANFRVDAQDIQQLAESSRLFPHRQITISQLQAALDQYRGELLHGFYDDWILEAREQFKQQYIELALQLVTQYRAASEYASAIKTAQKVLAIDRAYEVAHQHLIFLYAAQGDRAAALKQFDECTRALDEQLGVEPSAETIALVEKIKRQQTGGTSDAARLTNLPKPLTSFIGRERELQDLASLLRRGRLVTLTGAGGSGKTRLAIQIGTQVLGEYPDGVWWVDFSTLQEESLVPQQVARALGVQEQPHQAIRATLAEYLRAKQLLLILDNCEHLVGACAQIAEMGLHTGERIRILATSREALNIAAEQVYPVAPLMVPRANEISLAQLALEFSAVQLFVERARLAYLPFELDNTNAPFVLQICQRLDGIPLAIELAAARMKQMTVRELAGRLDQRFDLLVGTRTALPRQQTLRALIDWSFDLLHEQEKTLFMRLSVFAGGWTIASAQEICTDERLPREKFLDTLLRLVDKSLLIRTGDDRSPRYAMLETIHEYAREKAALRGNRQNTRARHLDYFVALAERAEAHYWDHEQQHWFMQLDNDQDNLRAALEYAMTTTHYDDALRLAGALAEYWRLRDRVQEGTERLARVLEAAPADSNILYLAKVLNGAGGMARVRGEIHTAIRLHERALELYRQANDAYGVAVSLRSLGGALMFSGNPLRARPCFLESLAIAKSLEDARLIEPLLLNLGIVESDLGNESGAASFFQEALNLATTQQNQFVVTISLLNLGCCWRRQGEYARALALLDEAAELAIRADYTNILDGICIEKGRLFLAQKMLPQATRSFRDGLQQAKPRQAKRILIRGLGGMAAVRHIGNKLSDAVQLFAATETLRQNIGLSWEKDEDIEYRERMTALRATLGARTFDDAWHTGAALTWNQAIELALAE